MLGCFGQKSLFIFVVLQFFIPGALANGNWSYTSQGSGDTIEIFTALETQIDELSEDEEMQMSDSLLPELWKPDGENKYPPSRSCRLALLEQILADKNVEFGTTMDALEQYIMNCQNEFSINAGWAPELFKYGSLDYNVYKNPHRKGVKVHTKDGRVIRGHLLMKPDRKKRPLVILICGLYCNAKDSTNHRQAVMQLFDEGPFHLLSLANMTGSDFSVDNGQVAVGGFDEGRQIYRVAQLFKEKDFALSERVHSIHVVGISLGGHAALYAGLYDSADKTREKADIKSILAFCPVVHLENSVKSLYESNWLIREILKWLTLKELRKRIEHVPFLGDLINLDDDLNNDEVGLAISKASYMYYRRITEVDPWDTPPFRGEQILSLEDLWRLNDFTKYKNQLEIPTLIIAAKNDRIVKTDKNAALINDRENPNVRVIEVNRGDHCGFSAVYGWRNTGQLWRDYILKHSPGFNPREGEQFIQVDDIVEKQNFITWKKLWEGGEFHVQQEWTASHRRDSIKATFWWVNKYNGNCEQIVTAGTYPDQCFKSMSLRVPYSRLQTLGIQQPRNKFEADRLARFANANWKWLDKESQNLNFTSSEPFGFLAQPFIHR